MSPETGLGLVLFFFHGLDFGFVGDAVLFVFLDQLLHLSDFLLVNVFQILGRPELFLPVEFGQFGGQELVALLRKGKLLFGLYFELQVLFVEFLVLGVGLLDLFERGLDFLVHHPFDALDLGLFLGQHVFCALLLGAGVH